MGIVSIIIVTYNAATTLPRTLESLRAQVGMPVGSFETILVDGASTDSTLQIADRYGRIDKKVSEPDRGIYDAMNKGAELATGKWLHFLNAGDSFSNPTALATVVRVLSEPQASAHKWAVSGAQNMRQLRANPIRIPSVPHRWLPHAVGLQPHCHQACWFDNDLFRALGGYSLEYETAGDFDLILRFGIAGQPLHLNGMLIDYLGGGISEGSRATPAILDRIRRERLGVGAGLAALIRHSVGVINTARTTAGGWRRSLMGQFA